MRTIISIFLLVSHTLAIATESALISTAQTMSKDQSLETDQRDLLLKIENNNNHKIVVNNQEDPNDCSRYQGTELKTKMRWLETATLKKNLINFGPQKRTLYAQSLHDHEIQELLGRLDGQDRKELQESIPDGGGKEFLATLENRVAPVPLSFIQKASLGIFITCIIVVGALTNLSAQRTAKILTYAERRASLLNSKKREST